ncbi:MAG: D-alanyl-D-alanine carboxypeptidase family protein [Lachnospiraceae bacterium]
MSGFRIKCKKWKRCMSAVLIFVLCLSMVSVSSASDVSQTEENKEALTAEELLKQELDKAYAIPTESNSWEGWKKGPGTYGEAAIVMEVETGTILYAKDIDSKQYPASITKVLTALVALENSQMSDKVTFSHDCVSFLQPGDSSVGLKEGNVITMEQTLYAMLLASANEAAYAVGENVGKNAGYDYDWFIQKMNERVKELGGVNSSFVNTNGLHDENHYTCARDMALIGRELFKHPEFFEIVQTLEYKIPESKTVEEHVFQQKDKMLRPQNADYYEYAIGGKTGYTSDALSTLITMADNGKMQLVCVVLRTHGRNIYPDTKNLLNYAFKNFKKVDVNELEQSEDVVEILGNSEDEDPEGVGSGYVVIPKKAEVTELDSELFPDGAGSDEATLSYTYYGTNVGDVRVRLSEEYLKENGLIEEEEESSDDTQKGKSKEPAWLKKLKKLDKLGLLEKTGIDERLSEMGKTELLILGAAVAALCVLIILFLFSLLLYLKRKKSETKRR